MIITWYLLVYAPIEVHDYGGELRGGKKQDFLLYALYFSRLFDI